MGHRTPNTGHGAKDGTLDTGYSRAPSFVWPNSFSIIYHGIFMARAFVSRNYAFIIQNAFYATKTKQTAFLWNRTG